MNAKVQYDLVQPRYHLRRLMHAQALTFENFCECTACLLSLTFLPSRPSFLSLPLFFSFLYSHLFPRRRQGVWEALNVPLWTERDGQTTFVHNHGLLSAHPLHWTDFHSFKTTFRIWPRNVVRCKSTICIENVCPSVCHTRESRLNGSRCGDNALHRTIEWCLLVNSCGQISQSWIYGFTPNDCVKERHPLSTCRQRKFAQ